jgi:uncharacterized protein YndB with AHSA1/START domain
MDKIIAQSVRLHCSTAHAFEMFTGSEYLEAWLASRAHVEAVVGGRYELYWDHMEWSHSSASGCKVTAIEAGKLLAFEWKGPGQFEQLMNGVDPLTHVTVFFIPADELFTASTDVYLIHSGWRRTPDWEEARRWFARAWRDAFEELQRQVNSSRSLS